LKFIGAESALESGLGSVMLFPFRIYELMCRSLYGATKSTAVAIRQACNLSGFAIRQLHERLSVRQPTLQSVR
jgi:hypothetical protein